MGLINCLSLLVYLLLFNACNQAEHSAVKKTPNKAEYNLENPTLSLKLPKELKEISGIAYFSEGKAIAIQDEHAVLYFLSLSSGEILDSITFGEDGDYEGITIDEENIYVLRSDGNIFQMPRSSTGKIESKKINTFLDNRYDTEGICFHPKTKNLLLACKENGDVTEEVLRNIYSFDPSTEITNKKAAFSIKHTDIKSFLEKAPETAEFDELSEYFEDLEEDFIYPSDIAVHPITGDIYITSAKVISILIVLGQEGKIKNMQIIPEEISPQTEGISFNPNGDMILCTEGKHKEERLFIYSWLK
jgi:hypothetical protein